MPILQFSVTLSFSLCIIAQNTTWTQTKFLPLSRLFCYGRARLLLTFVGILIFFQKDFKRLFDVVKVCAPLPLL